MSAATLAPSRLLPGDLLGVGSIGLRTRRMRAALSALGIAIGIASMVAVLGISASSQADLLQTIDRLGTNLLTVQAGQSFFGDDSVLPVSTGAKLASVSGVTASASVYTVSGATVRRNALVDPDDTSGIGVKAADLGLPKTLSATLAQGRFLTAATQHYPVVVLGSVAANRLGIDSLRGNPQVYIGGRYLTVVGILDVRHVVERHRPLGADRAAVRADHVRHRRKSLEHLRQGGRRSPQRRPQPGARDRQPRTPGGSQRQPARPMRWKPRPPRKAPSPPCSSASAPSHCW